MDKYILGIETSCDETAAAVVKNGNTLLSNIVFSQIDTHTQFGGVVPEVASRLHTENITYVIKKALKDAKLTLDQIDAIAVVKGPGLIGSLHVGLQAAKSLSLISEKPLIEVHHLAAHIQAIEFKETINYPSIALVVSGGHTEIVYMEKELNYKIIGSTQDDAIGEAYDKVARLLNLGYPGGPIIDKLAQKGKPTYLLPKPKVEGKYDVSYSGLKTAVINLVRKLERRNEEININDLCASFQEKAVEIILEPYLKSLEEYSIKQVILAGGVAANSHLREQIVEKTPKNIKVSLPDLWYCGDNAAMVALLGAKLYDRKLFTKKDIGADPNWKLEETSIKENE